MTIPAIPHDIDAEEAVLGSILMDPYVIEMVLPILSAESFYLIKNRWIYESVLFLHDARESIDIVTVCNHLKARHGASSDNMLNEVGGPAYISHLISCVPTSLHAESYAKIVDDMYRRRMILSSMSEMGRDVFDPTITPDEVEARALKRITSSRGRIGDGSVKRIASELLDDVSAWGENPLEPGQVRGLSLGYSPINRMLGGLEKQTLTIMGGRPGMAKSALAFSFAEKVAMQGKRVAIFSLEMAGKQVVARLACARARVNWHDVKAGNVVDGDGYSRLFNAISEISLLPLVIYDTSSATSFQIRATIARECAMKGLDFAVVDHIGLLSDRDENEVRKMHTITWSLKQTAKDFKLPVMAIAQLNRGIESRTDKRPVLSDFRESGRIEENIDIGIGLFREEYYDRNSLNNEIEIIILKNREGCGTGTAKLRFIKEYVRFETISLTGGIGL